jgi:outer membrane biosynthesis protein TonB
MEEVIKYFEQLESRLAAQEARLAAQEAQLAALEAKVAELENRPLPEPQVIEKIVEKPVEVIKEVVVEKPEVQVPETPKEPEIPETPAEPEIPVETTEARDHETTPEAPAPEAAPAPEEEPASPKAAIYGKAVDDIRMAISLGDRFLYQRELFGQNAELMQRTLTELNGLSSFDEAVSYISRFDWDTESNTYQQFIVTLHRRFG